MLRLKRFSSAVTVLNSRKNFYGEEKLVSLIALQNPCRWTSNRFLNIYQFGNKEAIEKERARLKYEMNRGYQGDMNEIMEHGGKIATANESIIPATAAVKFPDLEVNDSVGSSLKLPITPTGNGVEENKPEAPKASLLCVSFPDNSQAMIDSWSKPFLDKFKYSKGVHLYEISFIDSGLSERFKKLNFLTKKLLLRMKRKSNPHENKDVLHRQIVYSFGGHSYLRKELEKRNLLTGSMFLLDKFGRIRWQGTGLATDEGLSSLLDCTSLLLDEESK